MNGSEPEAMDAPTAPDPATKASQLEEEIEEVRDNLGSLVGELDRRRHRMLDVRFQLRRHAFPVAVAAVALAAIVAAGLARRRRQRARRDPSWTKSLLEALFAANRGRRTKSAARA